jgi:hypothetical protein
LILIEDKSVTLYSCPHFNEISLSFFQEMKYSFTKGT